MVKVAGFFSWAEMSVNKRPDKICHLAPTNCAFDKYLSYHQISLTTRLKLLAKFYFNNLILFTFLRTLNSFLHFRRNLANVPNVPSKCSKLLDFFEIFGKTPFLSYDISWKPNFNLRGFNICRTNAFWWCPFQALGVKFDRTHWPRPPQILV